MELITKEFNDIISQEDLDFLVWFDEQKKRADVINDKIKKFGHEFLEKTGRLETGYTQECDGYTVHLYETKPYKRTVVDTDALKEQGLYESFTKETPVKGSVKFTIDYEE